MRKVVYAGLLLALTSCGGAATTSTGTNTTPVAPTMAATTAATAAAAATTGGDSSLAGKLPDPGTVEAIAAQSVAKTVNVSLDKLKITNKTEKEWPDSSLGCPDADMMYSQMITSGYLLTYTDGAKTYEVHTDKTGNQSVVCENGKPVKAAQ